jgi:hypothetical protein
MFYLLDLILGFFRVWENQSYSSDGPTAKYSALHMAGTLNTVSDWLVVMHWFSRAAQIQIFFFCGIGDQTHSCMLGKHSATELYPYPKQVQS